MTKHNTKQKYNITVGHLQAHIVIPVNVCQCVNMYNMCKLLLLPINGNADTQMQKEEADSQKERKEGMYVCWCAWLSKSCLL